MTLANRPEDMLARADRACVSARLLFTDGDMAGACNRSYYAMFEAARAALMRSASPVTLESIRTHNGLIGAFGLHLVKSGRLPLDLGRALNRAIEIRLIADYGAAPLSAEDAEQAVSDAERFVMAIRQAISGWTR